MIPPLVIVPGAIWPLLPPGIHSATIHEIQAKYATTPHRNILFDGLKKGLDHLFAIGCPQVFLNGSYVTGKPIPNDYEVIWDPRFVNPNEIDPVFLDFSNGRKSQKLKFFGEYFPDGIKENLSGKSFLEFFQTDRGSGVRKGIIHIVNYLKGGGKYDN